MTKNEFENRLSKLYNKHPIIAKSEKKTVNELFYVLRMDDENDYNINVIDGGFVVSIPSVRECFVPVKLLAKHIKKVEVEEEDYGCDGVCLTVVTSK